MEIEVKSIGKEELEFVLKGEKHTFSNLLKTALLKDSKVKFAAYKLYHPFDDSAVFVIKTSGESPKKALENALKIIGTDLSDFEADLKKAIK